MTRRQQWHLVHFIYPNINVLWVHQITKQFHSSLKAGALRYINNWTLQAFSETAINGEIKHRALQNPVNGTAKQHFPANMSSASGGGMELKSNPIQLFLDTGTFYETDVQMDGHAQQ